MSRVVCSLEICVRNISQLSVDRQGEVPGREKTDPSPGHSPAPCLASHVLTGDYFAGKLANTRAHTPVLKISGPSTQSWNECAPKDWSTPEQNNHFILVWDFYKGFSFILPYFLDIRARVERWESESSESKDIELVEISADCAGICSSLGARHWPSQQDKN